MLWFNLIGEKVEGLREKKHVSIWTLRNEIKAQYTVGLFKRLFQVNKVTQMNCLSKSLTRKQNVRDPRKHFTKGEYVFWDKNG